MRADPPSVARSAVLVFTAVVGTGYSDDPTERMRHVCACACTHPSEYRCKYTFASRGRNGLCVPGVPCRAPARRAVSSCVPAAAVVCVCTAALHRHTRADHRPACAQTRRWWSPAAQRRRGAAAAWWSARACGGPLATAATTAARPTHTTPHKRSQLQEGTVGRRGAAS